MLVDGDKQGSRGGTENRGPSDAIGERRPHRQATTPAEQLRTATELLGGARAQRDRASRTDYGDERETK